MNVEIKVIAGAKRREIRLEGSGIRVKLMAKPIRGKANEELIDLIADTFRLKRRDVHIIAGEKDTRKIVSIPVDEGRIREVLGRAEHEVIAR